MGKSPVLCATSRHYSPLNLAPTVYAIALITTSCRERLVVRSVGMKCSTRPTVLSATTEIPITEMVVQPVARWRLPITAQASTISPLLSALMLAFLSTCSQIISKGRGMVTGGDSSSAFPQTSFSSEESTFPRVPRLYAIPPTRSPAGIIIAVSWRP